MIYLMIASFGYIISSTEETSANNTKFVPGCVCQRDYEPSFFKFVEWNPPKNLTGAWLEEELATHSIEYELVDKSDFDLFGFPYISIELDLANIKYAISIYAENTTFELRGVPGYAAYIDMAGNVICIEPYYSYVG